jgi:hypothetical protein
MDETGSMIVTRARIESLFNDLAAAKGMVKYWQGKGCVDGVIAWGLYRERIVKSLEYCADHLEFFAGLRAGRVHDEVMVIVEEIRDRIKGEVEPGAEADQEGPRE